MYVHFTFCNVDKFISSNSFLVEILGLQTKEYRRIFHTKKAMVAILILGKIDLKSKTVTKKKRFLSS